MAGIVLLFTIVVIMSDEENPDEHGMWDSDSMPFSAYNEYFKFDEEKDSKNFLSKCKLCPVAHKSLSCAYDSPGNVKKHLKVSEIASGHAGSMKI